MTNIKILELTPNERILISEAAKIRVHILNQSIDTETKQNQHIKWLEKFKMLCYNIVKSREMIAGELLYEQSCLALEKLLKASKVNEKLQNKHSCTIRKEIFRGKNSLNMTNISEALWLIANLQSKNISHDGISVEVMNNRLWADFSVEITQEARNKVILVLKVRKQIAKI